MVNAGRIFLYTVQPAASKKMHTYFSKSGKQRMCSASSLHAVLSKAASATLPLDLETAVGLETL